MRRDEALAIIRAHEAELRALGVERIELFGSVARDEAGPGSDVDVLVKFDDRVCGSGWKFAKHLEDVEKCLADVVGAPVDVATLPLRRTRFGHNAARDRVRAY